MLHAIGVCIANALGGYAILGLPLASQSNYSKLVSQVTLVKCEIKANASAVRDFSPDTAANVEKIF